MCVSSGPRAVRSGPSSTLADSDSTRPVWLQYCWYSWEGDEQLSPLLSLCAESFNASFSFTSISHFHTPLSATMSFSSVLFVSAYSRYDSISFIGSGCMCKADSLHQGHQNRKYFWFKWLASFFFLHLSFWKQDILVLFPL